jgi:hypothetical protein
VLPAGNDQRSVAPIVVNKKETIMAQPVIVNYPVTIWGHGCG